MTELVIDEALHENIPPLDADDYAALKAAIEREGCITDPILCWNDGEKLVIVDGVHRFKISKELGITCPHTVIGENLSRDEIQSIAESRAADRRNMSTAAKIQLRKISAARRAKKIAKVLAENLGGDKTPNTKVSPMKPLSGQEPNPQAENAKKSKQDVSPKSRKVAEELGLSRSTLVRAVEFDELVQKLCSPARRAIESGAVVATEEELKALASLPEEQQIVVIRKVRVGQANAISDLVKLPKKQKPKPKKKPKKKLDPHFYWNQIDARFGELVRLIDKAAKELELPDDGTRSIIMDYISNAMEATQEMLGVEIK